MSSGIYLIKNKINGHLYIGKSKHVERRYSQHICKSLDKNSKEYNYPIHRAIRKYGKDNFVLEILERIEPYDENKANERERYWIKRFNTFLNNKHYNASSGGEVVCDREVSKETREKLSKSQKKAISNQRRKTKS